MIMWSLVRRYRALLRKYRALLLKYRAFGKNILPSSDSSWSFDHHHWHVHECLISCDPLSYSPALPLPSPALPLTSLPRCLESLCVLPSSSLFGPFFVFSRHLFLSLLFLFSFLPPIPSASHPLQPGATKGAQRRCTLRWNWFFPPPPAAALARQPLGEFIFEVINQFFFFEMVSFQVWIFISACTATAWSCKPATRNDYQNGKSESETKSLFSNVSFEKVGLYFRGGSSSSGLFIGEPPKIETPQGEGVSFDQSSKSVFKWNVSKNLRDLQRLFLTLISIFDKLFKSHVLGNGLQHAHVSMCFIFLRKTFEFFFVSLITLWTFVITYPHITYPHPPTLFLVFLSLSHTHVCAGRCSAQDFSEDDVQHCRAPRKRIEIFFRYHSAQSPSPLCGQRIVGRKCWRADRKWRTARMHTHRRTLILSLTRGWGGDGRGRSSTFYSKILKC